jgi:sulfate/thiosulfate transport system substrate-binding protein
MRRALPLLALGLLLPGCTSRKQSAAVTLLNVSYDPTRELWKELNERFVADYERRAGLKVAIKQSHGGSSSQARSVIDGLDADVTTLASFVDTDAIRRSGLIQDGWVDRLPNRSRPYVSTIVFVVRKGNPRGVRDWPDLVHGDVRVVTPNPKTSANGYIALFAAWGSVKLRGGSDGDATEYLRKLYAHVPVLDSGARGATTTFSQKGIGDVHLTWENEARLEVREAKGALEIVYPPLSILAEPQVTVVDKTVDRKKTRAVAEAYLQWTYGDEAQEIAAKHFYRPSSPEVLKRHAADFPELRLFSITEIAPGWGEAHARFVGTGGVFDTIYQPK